MNKQRFTQRKMLDLLSSLTIAIMLCAEYLAMLLEIYGGRSSGNFTVVMMIALVCAACCLVLNPTKVISKRFLFLVTIVLVCFGITRLLVADKSNLAPVDFFGMCIIPIILGGIIRADYRKVLTISMLFLCLGLPVFDTLFLKANTGSAYDAVTMGDSYALLPVIGAGIIHFFFFRKDSGLLEKMMYCITLMYILYFLRMSYRGAWISVFLMILLGWIFSGKGLYKPKRGAVLLVIIGLFAVVYFVFENQLLNAVESVLRNHNIKVAFIDKSLLLLGRGDITHGRRAIWSTAFEGFFKSPIWGHGMTTFKYYTGNVFPFTENIFPHNFVLQFMFDGGLLLTVPMLSILIKGLKDTFRLMKSKNVEKFSFIILLAVSSIPRVMVSAEVWRVSKFWLMMGMLSSLLV